MAINNGNNKNIVKDSMLRLKIYYKKINDYNKLLCHYLLNINLLNFHELFELVVYYNKKKQFENMEKYYSLFIQKIYEHIKKDYNISIFYYFKNKIIHQEIFKIFCMRIEKEDSYALFQIQLFFSNNYTFYNWLLSLNYTNNIINRKIKKLKTRKMLKYIKQIKSNIDNIKECIICYETKINIKFNCNKHYICINCFAIIGNKCYYRCK